MNSPFIPEEPGENDPPHLQPDDMTLVLPSAAEPEHTPRRSVTHEYYTQEDDQEEHADSGSSAQFAVPFQPSTAMPVWEPQADSAASSGTVKKRARSHLRFWMIALLVLVIVAATGFLWVTVFAQPTQPLSTISAAPHPTVALQQTPMTKPPLKPAATTKAPTSASRPSGNGIPQHLPTGWTAAGLTEGDALFAARTAWTFTDREEALDFRNVGTRMQHAGTLTASTFLLSAGGRTRFFQNDVRVINNTLFDHVQTVKLIQIAVNGMTNLVQFQMQGPTQFALVDASYQLYQSQINPATGQRIEALETNSATHQPRTHHMSVLLLRVTPGTQGVDAPMGGSGWLVSNYGLDLTSSLVITHPI